MHVMRSNRRRLSAAEAAEEAGGEEPAARLWGNHLLMVLDEAGEATALQQELRQELGKVLNSSAKAPSFRSFRVPLGCLAVLPSYPQHEV